ncbi:5-formyltetrahydrofolate cyclo-ligase [Candidatus Berkelbacteria bacterium]|nr:5-formyltetrahydrofolate cyclo-ligase [Candidatus Berkelbacteria bacterium]
MDLQNLSNLSAKNKKECLRIELRSKRRRYVIGAHASNIFLSRFLACHEFAVAKRYFVYVDHQGEASTNGIINWILKNDKQLFLPVRISEKQMLPARVARTFNVDRNGFLTQKNWVPYREKIDVCLVPGLAFTKAGQRLGTGKGYYDRYLAQYPPYKSVGLAWDWQILPDIPTESHDVLMNYILTPTHLYVGK